MPKLELDRAYLDSLFEYHVPSKEIRLRIDLDGQAPTMLNTQQLYNWFAETWSGPALMAQRVPLKPSGFRGLQPVIKAVHGWMIRIPGVPIFYVWGEVLTEEPGLSPFVKDDPATVLFSGSYARPHGRIFLSHSSLDKLFARELYAALIPKFEVFLDEADIRPSQSIPKVIGDAIERADVLVLVLSTSAVASRWVTEEWAAMKMMGGPVVCVKIDDADPPALLGHEKFIEYGGDIGLVVSQISRAEGLSE